MRKKQLINFQPVKSSHATVARFKPIAEVSPRGKSTVLKVRLFERYLHIAAGFGRYLDDMGVSAFYVLADDDAEQVALGIFVKGEEEKITHLRKLGVDVFDLRPSGLGSKNTGRRINIERSFMSRPWLRKMLMVQSEAEATYSPVYSEEGRMFVLEPVLQKSQKNCA